MTAARNDDALRDGRDPEEGEAVGGTAGSTGTEGNMTAEEAIAEGLVRSDPRDGSTGEDAGDPRGGNADR